MDKGSDGKMARALTAEELTEQFLEHLHDAVDYWSNVQDQDTREKLNGLAFTILSTLDGCSVSLPAFDIVARPHENNKEYHTELGINYIEDGTILECWLHERWHRKRS